MWATANFYLLILYNIHIEIIIFNISSSNKKYEARFVTQVINSNRAYDKNVSLIAMHLPTASAYFDTFKYTDYIRIYTNEADLFGIFRNCYGRKYQRIFQKYLINRSILSLNKKLVCFKLIICIITK